MSYEWLPYHGTYIYIPTATYCATYSSDSESVWTISFLNSSNSARRLASRTPLGVKQSMSASNSARVEIQNHFSSSHGSGALNIMGVIWIVIALDRCTNVLLIRIRLDKWQLSGQQVADIYGQIEGHSFKILAIFSKFWLFF